VVDALVAAQKKISSGELKPSLRPDATDQEKADYRKGLGIPEAPEKYDLTFDNGLVIGQDDKPVVDAFLKAAHGSMMTPDQVKKTVQWWHETKEAQAEARSKQDLEFKRQAEDTLREEWGPDFRRNLNIYEALLDTLPKVEGDESMKDLLRFGRLSNGRPIGSSPEVIKWLAGIQLQLNPAATVVSGTGDQMQSIDSRLSEISKYRRENRTAYYKDEGMQAEERKLLEAKSKMSARQKG
jgi:hypothetical protein